MTLRFHDWARVRPVDLRPEDAVGLKVVAVVGHDDTWAAYMGLTDWTDEETARQGDKIDARAAALLFPQYVRAGLTYRD